MRINVYEEELTSDVEVVSTTADTGHTFYGVRLYLKSAPELHNNELDDDRSAVTIWVGDHDFADKLVDVIQLMLSEHPKTS
jgi:hypothetical protein